MSQRNEAAGRLRLRFFGGFSADVAGAVAPQKFAPPSVAILLVLAAAPDLSAERDWLAETFWANSEASDRRQPLRLALLQLRKGVANIIEGQDRYAVRLNPGLTDCDLWDLRDYLKAPEKRPLPPISGPLLARWPFPTTARLDWDTWVASKRNEIVRDYSGQILPLIESMTQHDHADGPALARVLLDLNDCDETFGIAVVRYHLAHGRLREAREARERVMKSLREQFGVEPSPDFQRKTEIREATSPAGRTPAAAPANGSTPAPPENTSAAKLPQLLVFRFAETGRPRTAKGDSGDTGYLADAVPYQLLRELRRQSWFRLVAADLPSYYYPPGVEIGQAYVPSDAYQLKGTYSTQGDTVTISVTLMHGKDGEVLLANDFGGREADIQTLSFEIAAAVSEAILGAEGERATQRTRTMASLENVDDWTMIMKARHLFWNTSPNNNASARALLDQVRARGTVSMPLLSLSVFVRLLDVWSFWSNDPDGDLDDALRIANEAGRIAPQDPWSYFCVGTVQGARGKPREAIAFLDRALDLQPSFNAARGERGRLKLFIGEIDAGREDAMQALARNPHDPHNGLWLNTLGLADLLRGRYGDALGWAEKAIVSNSYWFQNHTLKAAAHCHLGQRADAEEAFAAARHLANGMSRARFHHGHPFTDKAAEAVYLTPLEALGLS